MNHKMGVFLALAAAILSLTSDLKTKGAIKTKIAEHAIMVSR